MGLKDITGGKDKAPAPVTDDELTAALAQLSATSAASDSYMFRNDAMQMNKEMVEDNFTQERLKDNPLWPFATKSCKLTFMEDQDMYALSQLLEAEACKAIRSRPPCEQTNKFYEELGQARIIALFNLMRARGTDKAQHMINERIANISQFSSSFSTLSGSPQGAGKLAAIKRLGGGGRR